MPSLTSVSASAPQVQRSTDTSANTGSSSNSLSGGAIAGIVIGVIVGVLLILVIIVVVIKKRSQDVGRTSPHTHYTYNNPTFNKNGTANYEPPSEA